MKKIVTAFLIVSLLCSGIPCEAKTKDTIYLEKGQTYSLKLKENIPIRVKAGKKFRFQKQGKYMLRELGAVR